jgi:hypothetical protein
MVVSVMLVGLLVVVVVLVVVRSIRAPTNNTLHQGPSRYLIPFSIQELPCNQNKNSSARIQETSHTSQSSRIGLFVSFFSTIRSWKGSWWCLILAGDMPGRSVTYVRHAETLWHRTISPHAEPEHPVLHCALQHTTTITC